MWRISLNIHVKINSQSPNQRHKYTQDFVTVEISGLLNWVSWCDQSVACWKRIKFKFKVSNVSSISSRGFSDKYPVSVWLRQDVRHFWFKHLLDNTVLCFSFCKGLDLLAVQSKTQDASCLPALKVSDIEPTIPVTPVQNSTAGTSQCPLCHSSHHIYTVMVTY